MQVAVLVGEQEEEEIIIARWRQKNLERIDAFSSCLYVPFLNWTFALGVDLIKKNCPYSFCNHNIFKTNFSTLLFYFLDILHKCPEEEYGMTVPVFRMNQL